MCQKGQSHVHLKDALSLKDHEANMSPLKGALLPFSGQNDTEKFTFPAPGTRSTGDFPPYRCRS